VKIKKIILIGCGKVGESFLFSAIHQSKLAHDNFILIDVNQKSVLSLALDINDAYMALYSRKSNIRVGDYDDCNGADLIIITAGRAQKVNEPRLNMIDDNIKIIREISSQVKNTNFNGFVIIASNPVDLLTTVFYQETKQKILKEKIFGSGTYIDNVRLRRLLSEKLDVDASLVKTMVLGEHEENTIVD
jgi:L-lactate dehydrogenase